MTLHGVDSTGEARALRMEDNLEVSHEGGNSTMVLPALDEYEVIVLDSSGD